MNIQTIRDFGRRTLVALVSVALVIGPLTGPAYAATPLADIPIASKVTAKPNIVYTMDDSGSMQFGYLPDWVVAGGTAKSVTKITRAGAVATVTIAANTSLSTGQFVLIAGATQPEYNGQFPITVLSSTSFTYPVVGTPATPATGTITYTVGAGYCRGGNNTTGCSVGSTNGFTSPPFYAASFNTLAYDPDVNYTPPVKADGTSLTHTVGIDTDVNGNQTFLGNVQTDPFTAPNTHANLTALVSVPVYCNTDWPKLLNDPNWSIGPNGLKVQDVGDANGENTPTVAGIGDWCRINGTAYTASAASGAPAVIDDYNYPYQSSSGAKGAQYFYQQLSVKSLWCDKTSPYWPRNGTIIGCTMGGTPTCGGLPCGVTQQKCNRNGLQCNSTVALRNYTPAACKAGPAVFYCAPNTGGSDGNALGTGIPPECLACTCNADYQPAGGKCSITGAVCNGPYGILGGDPLCPNQTVAPNGCSAGVPIYGGPASSASCTSNTWDPVAGVYMGTNLYQDSQAQGYACRHNNRTYAVSAAGGGGLFTYPRTALGDVYAANQGAPYNQLGQFTTQVTSGCPTVGTTIGIPRHYYQIDSILFCDNVDFTVNGPWKGFGAGACPTDVNDLTRYQNVKYGQFHRIGLISGRTFPYVDQVSGVPLSRTYAQEIVNYGNWFAYYRLRSLAAKTTSSLAFNLLNDEYRVGFHTLGTEPPPDGLTNPPAVTWVDVKDFTPGFAGHKTTWWNALFAVPTVTNYKTPTLSAMLRIGDLFDKDSAKTALPANVAPLPAGAANPYAKDANNKVISCQSNFHILFTDGFTNQVALPVKAGDQDQNPLTLPADVAGDPDKILTGLRVSPWPKPFRQSIAVPETLADIAMSYWARDLYTGLTNDVPAWSGKTPNDVDPTKDVAWWQHVNFSAISFGAAGTLDATNQKATLAAIVAGTAQWPNLTSPNSPPRPAGNIGAVAVDDLWHATVNARGRFVYARSPLEVQYGLAAILAGISNQRKSRAGAAFSGQVLSSTNNIIYEATIEQGWAGELLKVKIDPKDGSELATLWQAGTVLKNAIKPVAVGDEFWMNESKRRIVTWDDSAIPKKAAFRATPAGSMATVLSATQLNTLSANATVQKKMVAYLRGGSTVNPPLGPNIGTVIEGTGIGQYRERFGALGDISNAQPLVVSAPVIPAIFNSGADPGYDGPGGFAATQKASGYTDRIVAAANDGMVHVFDSTDGHEVLAYVPSSLLRNTVDASGKPTGLQALTFQDGGVPIYKHHFYVDASPRTSDVDFNSAGVKGGGSDWHTIVVGGMGKGGKQYYALDLTNPDATTEAQAAAKLLWETTDADWTYTYGRPIIVKTYAYGWTVIVTSGYDNVSGEGRIHFLNPKTGLPYRPPMRTPLITCVGPGGIPQRGGLTQINGFTKDFHNQFVEQVYGGDLCGNLWRFDLEDPAGNYVNPSAPFATMSDGSNPQPITTAPQIEIDYANGVDRYVFVGTGRLLDTTDMTTPSPAQQQTLYALRDGTLSTPLPTTSFPIDARAATLAVVASGAPLVGGTVNGWHHDLPTGALAERVVIDVEADVNTVAYIGTQVQNDPCIIALPARIYAREYATGKSLVYDGSGNPWVDDPAGGVGLQIVGLTDPVTGEITLGGLLSHEIPGTAPIKFLNPLTGGRARFSWRLLTGE